MKKYERIPKAFRKLSKGILEVEPICFKEIKSARITNKMSEDLAKTFSPSMEGQAVKYLWKHFKTVLDKHKLKIVKK